MTGTGIGIAIVDSGGANLASLQYALQRLGAESIVSDDPERIASARRVLLPGVGAVGSDARMIPTVSICRPALIEDVSADDAWRPEAELFFGRAT